MRGLSNLVLELSLLGIFKSVESMDYVSLSKDHLGDISVKLNDEQIVVHVFSGDDANSIAEKIINKANFD